MNNNIDWKDVEQKISIICYKFSNLEPWHEDLAQELRIHAYYCSDNYYDLYRKAIDFWRKLKTQQFPETPYSDLEVLNLTDYDKSEEFYSFDETVELLKKELKRPGNTKWEDNMQEVATKLLNIIIGDIDYRVKETTLEVKHKDFTQYINHRLNLSWISEETGIGYKRLVAAMKFLEDLVRGLAAMNKIDIPKEYFEGFYEE